MHKNCWSRHGFPASFFAPIMRRFDTASRLPSHARAFDQYGQPFSVPSPQWTATGGTVAAGLFLSSQNGPSGLFTVRAEVNGLEAIAEVRVVATSDDAREDDSKDDDGPRSRVLQWQGDVPPQKWMNFYTKVLSRFASTHGLKLKVTFEVPAEGDQGQAKADEARSGLRELGLNDGVHLT